MLTREAEEVQAFVGAVERGGGGSYRTIRAAVDSGAEDSVVPPGVFPGALEPSDMSRRGATYKAANGTAIPNLGQTEVLFGTGEGHQCKLAFQVASVERPLISAAHLARAGQAVILGEKGGLIYNPETKRRINLVREGNLYVLEMKVFMPDFARRGP